MAKKKSGAKTVKKVAMRGGYGRTQSWTTREILRLHNIGLPPKDIVAAIQSDKSRPADEVLPATDGQFITKVRNAIANSRKKVTAKVLGVGNGGRMESEGGITSGGRRVGTKIATDGQIDGNGRYVAMMALIDVVKVHGIEDVVAALAVIKEIKAAN